MNAPAAMPSMPELQAALRTTTERLVDEITSPRDTIPDWDDMHWAVARAAAAMHGISMLLATRLRWAGPPAWERFLGEQMAQSRARELRAWELLTRLDAGLRLLGVHAVGLKGSALRKLALYLPGERPMADVDLLTTPGDEAGVIRALACLGYLESFCTRRHRVFCQESAQLPAGIGEQLANPLKVELHLAVADPLPLVPVDITTQLAARDAPPGLGDYASPAALFTHLALHAAGNMRSNALRAIQLNDLALLAARFDAADWQCFISGNGSGVIPWWAYPPLQLAAHCLRAPIPPQVLQALRRACPAWLARAAFHYRLTDVSWSNLHAAAAPGIEWSRTAAEALRYLHSRAFPSREVRNELRVATDAQPALDQIPWYRLRQRTRLWRWMRGRAPRVQTLWTLQQVITGVTEAPAAAATRRSTTPARAPGTAPLPESDARNPGTARSHR